MKSIHDQKILITGATDGIGALTAKKLAGQGAHLLVHGRSPEKLNQIAGEIRKETGNNNIEEFIADLASLNNVEQLANEVLKNHNALDVLINNAGVGFGNEFQQSHDGYEMRLAVNYLAPFLLTHLLLPALEKGAPSRIVNVSSAGQSPLTLEDHIFSQTINPRKAYSQSKLALNMFTIELANRLKDKNITVNSLHPGTYLNTKMVREAKIDPLGEAETGAEAIIYLATSSDLDHVTGQYFDRKSKSKAIGQAYDENARKKLWTLSLTATGLEKGSFETY